MQILRSWIYKMKSVRYYCGMCREDTIHKPYYDEETQKLEYGCNRCGNTPFIENVEKEIILNSLELRLKNLIKQAGRVIAFA